MMAKERGIRLGDLQLRIMRGLWDAGAATVSEVRQQLRGERLGQCHGGPSCCAKWKTAGDPAGQWLADLAGVLLWWHPLVWWAGRQWRAAGELAADEACLLVPRGADTLAACLVMLARRLECRPRLAWMAMAEPGFRSALGKRVERLLSLSASAWRPPTRRWILVVTATLPVALLLAAVSCTAWARTQVPLTEGATTMKVYLNCWRQSLAAVAVAAVLSPAAGDTPTIFAAEGEPVPVKVEREGHEPAPVKVEREGERRNAPAAKERGEGERREGERREARGEGGERRAEAREGRERGGEEREARAREMAQHREQLQKEAQEIRQKLESLKPDQDAEARELKGALERIEHQLRELQPPHEPRPAMPDRARVQARLEELKAAIHRAAEAGRGDEAERLEREAHELMRMLEQRPGERPPGAPEGGERERRLHHLRAAIENLHAAGLHEPAEALARQAEALMRGGDMPREPRPEGGPRPEGPPPHLERAVDELRQQMEEMRRQMDEIRHALKTLSERPIEAPKTRTRLPST
jgi:hypothetical protein